MSLTLTIFYDLNNYQNLFKNLIKGAKGERGNAGEEGIKGATGRVGERGEYGKPGFHGVDGPKVKCFNFHI